MLAPVAVELGWLLVGNSGVLPERPDAVLERYRLAVTALAGEAGRGRRAIRRAADVSRPTRRSRARRDGTRPLPDRRRCGLGDWPRRSIWPDRRAAAARLAQGPDAEAGAILGSGVAAADDLGWWCDRGRSRRQTPPQPPAGFDSARRGEVPAREDDERRRRRPAAVTTPSTTRSLAIRRRRPGSPSGRGSGRPSRAGGPARPATASRAPRGSTTRRRPRASGRAPATAGRTTPRPAGAIAPIAQYSSDAVEPEERQLADPELGGARRSGSIR